jgi:hypothetical protein
MFGPDAFAFPAQLSFFSTTTISIPAFACLSLIASPETFNHVGCFRQSHGLPVCYLGSFACQVPGSARCALFEAFVTAIS